MRYFTLLLLCALLPSCTLGNINSIYRTPTLKYGASHIVDAKQRFVLTYPGLVELDSQGNVIPTKTISCAEPSPDVFSVFAASAEASVSQGGASGAGSFATSETGAALLKRTPGLQALRDAYFRLCEAYGNGMIDEIDFMVGQRHNQTVLVGLIAIEEMNAVVNAPPPVIGSQAAANSASGIKVVTDAISELATENVTLRVENEELERTKNNNSMARMEQQKIYDNQELPTPQREQAKTERDRLDQENIRLTERVNANAATIESNDATRQALLTRLASGDLRTGSSVGSVLQDVNFEEQGTCNAACAAKRVLIAQQMTEIVKTLNNNDFGPTICLSHLRKSSPANLPRYAVGDGAKTYISDICKKILDAYVKSLETSSVVRVRQSAAIQQDSDLLKQAFSPQIILQAEPRVVSDDVSSGVVIRAPARAVPWESLLLGTPEELEQEQSDDGAPNTPINNNDPKQ